MRMILSGLGLLIASAAAAQADSYSIEFVKSENPENKGQYRVANVSATVTPRGGYVGFVRANGDVGLPNGWSTFVYTMKAKSADGKELPVSYAGGGKWRLDGWTGGPVSVDYAMLLQHDRFPNDPGIDELAYARDFGVMWTGRALMIEGASSNADINISFKAPEGWKLTTPWRDEGDGRNFIAKNSDDVLDSAFMAGEQITYDLKVAGGEARIGVAPALKKLASSLSGTTRKSLIAYEGLFNAPMSDRLLVIASDANYAGGGVMGRSISIVLGGDDSATNNPSYIVAHEAFHLWNVQWNYGSNSSDVEWLKEGLAEYYANLSAVRDGRLSKAAFLNELGNRIGVYLSSRGSESIAAAGATKLQDENSYNMVYSGGMLALAALDASIRRDTSNAKCLDDVVRRLHQTYAAADAPPLTLAALGAAASEEAGQDMLPFFDRYVGDDEPIPIDELASYYGLKIDVANTQKVAVAVDPRANAAQKAAWSSLTAPTTH